MEIKIIHEANFFTYKDWKEEVKTMLPWYDISFARTWYRLSQTTITYQAKTTQMVIKR